MKSWNKNIWLAAASIAVLILPLHLSAQTPAPAPPAPPARVLQVRGGYLGVGIQEITAERAKALRLPEESGVEVTRVSSESPAEKAGILAGDVILQYNGMKVEGIEQLTRLVRETPGGREVRIDISRNGVSQSVTARIGANPAARFLGDGFNFNMPDVPRIIQGVRSPMLGIEAEPLEGQLAQYFGVTEGVLVRSVVKDSSAEKSGIRAGDVILKVDDAKVGTPAEITKRLRPLTGRSIALTLMREKREMAVTVTVEAPSGSSPFGRARRSEFLLSDE